MEYFFQRGFRLVWQLYEKLSFLIIKKFHQNPYNNIILPILGNVNPFWVIYDKIIIKRGKKMKFCERLKQIRIENNMSQKDVYTKLEMSCNGYASYEQGRTEPNIATIIKLCKIFKVSADYLLGIED